MKYIIALIVSIILIVLLRWISVSEFIVGWFGGVLFVYTLEAYELIKDSK